jgi:acyl-CoA hydrolase
LLAGPLRPDVVIVSAARVDGAWQLTTEASWITAAVAGAARVLVVERPLCPVAVDEPALPIQRVTVIGSDPEPSVAIPAPEISQDHHAIGRLIAPLIPEGARVQFGPGPIGAATLQELSYPVQIDTGIINDSVVDLDARGLVMGEPLAPYALGSPAVYRWIEGRPMLRAISHTHDPARLAAGPPLMAVNTALEMDLDGQVNLERVGGSTVGGVGGHPDYSAAAATSCNGLSIVALPSVWAGRSTLVQRLEAPTTTSRSDIDIVVTEHGLGDLRGLDSGARRSVIRSLWAEVN